MNLTDEQRATHIGNAECGTRALLVAVAHHASAIDAHMDRWGFDADTHEHLMEALEAAGEILGAARELLDVSVVAYARASVDLLKDDGRQPDCYDEAKR